MNLQLSRIENYCQELNLVSIPTNWAGIANQILVKEGSYADFLEQVLFDELEAKKTRTKNTLLKMASLPSIKTLDHYDFNFATGTPKALVHELAGAWFY